jgi:class 3 adenylate cyclase
LGRPCWLGANLFPPDFDKSASDVIEFVTGDRPVDVDRVLAIVLFTDIIGSTELAASGDQRWHALLDTHDRVVRDQLRRFKRAERSRRRVTGSLSLSKARQGRFAVRRPSMPGWNHRDSSSVSVFTPANARSVGMTWGLAVHIAARIGALATAKEILVSSTVRDLVIGSGIEFIERGNPTSRVRRTLEAVRCRRLTRRALSGRYRTR